MARAVATSSCTLLIAKHAKACKYRDGNESSCMDSLGAQQRLGKKLVLDFCKYSQAFKGKYVRFLLNNEPLILVRHKEYPATVLGGKQSVD